MADTYLHRPEGVSSSVTKMKSLISDYKDKIIEITNLVNTINGSTAWKDAVVKTINDTIPVIVSINDVKIFL